MAARIGRFSDVALIRVRADRGSWAVCDGVLLAEGKLRVVVDRAYQLHEAAAAHDLIKDYVACRRVSAWDGRTTDWVRLVNTLVNRQLHGLRLGGRHGGRQGLQVPGLGHCVAGFRNSGAENDLGELGQG
jgi:hypothetical protein